MQILVHTGCLGSLVRLKACTLSHASGCVCVCARVLTVSHSLTHVVSQFHLSTEIF